MLSHMYMFDNSQCVW